MDYENFVRISVAVGNRREGDISKTSYIIKNTSIKDSEEFIKVYGDLTLYDLTKGRKE